VLSDDELRGLREIERRLRRHAPELVRLFNGHEPQLAKIRRQLARARVLLATCAITGVVQLGPRVLTETEVRTRQRAPRPRTARFRTTVVRRTEPVSGPAALSAPIAVADIRVAPRPTVTTPLCRTA
jgi:hypothetical protein